MALQDDFSCKGRRGWEEGDVKRWGTRVQTARRMYGTTRPNPIESKSFVFFVFVFTSTSFIFILFSFVVAFAVVFVRIRVKETERERMGAECEYVVYVRVCLSAFDHFIYSPSCVFVFAQRFSSVLHACLVKMLVIRNISLFAEKHNTAHECAHMENAKELFCVFSFNTVGDINVNADDHRRATTICPLQFAYSFLFYVCDTASSPR